MLERDSLVRERACHMIEEEGLSACAVADPALFDSLREALPFEVFVLGIPALDALPSPVRAEFPGPVVLLAPIRDRSLCAHLRLVAPRASLVDRALRDPDSLRGALGRSGSATPGTRPETGDVPSPVRRAFEPFGVSER